MSMSRRFASLPAISPSAFRYAARPLRPDPTAPSDFVHHWTRYHAQFEATVLCPHVIAYRFVAVSVIWATAFSAKRRHASIGPFERMVRPRSAKSLAISKPARLPDAESRLRIRTPISSVSKSTALPEAAYGRYIGYRPDQRPSWSSP